LSKQPVLETDRLVLRPFRLTDAQDAQTLAGHREVASTTYNIPHPYEDGMAETWISTHEDTFKQGKGVTYAMTLKDDGRLVGCISLMGLKLGHQGELGYWIGVPYWGKGYCTEAGEALLEYGFTKLDLNRIHASYFSRNPASGRVMEKLGMTYEGTRKQHILKWGKFEDLALKGILKKDWIKRK
jgi:ribosomal-protein-alanine N-acetyltransferase